MGVYELSAQEVCDGYASGAGLAKIAGSIGPATRVPVEEGLKQGELYSAEDPTLADARQTFKFQNPQNA